MVFIEKPAGAFTAGNFVSFRSGCVYQAHRVHTLCQARGGGGVGTPGDRAVSPRACVCVCVHACTRACASAGEARGLLSVDLGSTELGGGVVMRELGISEPGTVTFGPPVAVGT